jgi:hypothetical protein
MTTRQFAYIVGTDLKWIQNAARLLKKTLRYSLAEAAWFRLVHHLHEGAGIPLAKGAKLATRALKAPEETATVQEAITAHDEITLSIDMAYFRSTVAARAATANTFHAPRVRGRRKTRKRNAIEAATAFGVDVSLLQFALSLTPTQRLEKLDRDATELAELRRGMVSNHSRA